MSDYYFGSDYYCSIRDCSWVATFPWAAVAIPAIIIFVIIPLCCCFDRYLKRKARREQAARDAA